MAGSAQKKGQADSQQLLSLKALQEVVTASLALREARVKARVRVKVRQEPVPRTDLPVARGNQTHQT